MFPFVALGIRMQKIENEIPEMENLRYHVKCTFNLAMVPIFVWFILLSVRCWCEI